MGQPLGEEERGVCVGVCRFVCVGVCLFILCFYSNCIYIYKIFVLRWCVLCGLRTEAEGIACG